MGGKKREKKPAPFFVRVLREITDYVYDDCVVAAQVVNDRVALFDGLHGAGHDTPVLHGAEVGIDYEELPPLLDLETTQRGFAVGEFLDRYGERCSIQDSSLATERAIWFGVHNPVPKIMARDAPEEWLAPVGDPERNNGWVNVPLPEGTLIGGRMHLSQHQVIELLPILQRFADTGSIHAEDDEDGDV